MCHSEPVYRLGIQLDYQGILLLMWGSTVPLIYYSFPYDTQLQTSYWSAATALASLCSLATIHDSVGAPHLGHIRAALFSTFGIGSFLVPIAHGMLRDEALVQSQRIGAVWIAVTVFFNGVGVVAYTFKVR
jgi:adiponectin receptor